jgi:hypothetical protein
MLKDEEQYNQNIYTHRGFKNLTFFFINTYNIFLHYEIRLNY